MSALSAQLAVGEEVSYGTAVTPSRFTELVSESVQASYARVESAGLRPGRLYRSGARFVPYVEGAAGDVVQEVGTKGFGVWLKHMLGSVASGALTDSTYTHTFTPGPLAGRSLTLQIGRPLYDESAVQPFTYPGCKVASWELACGTDGLLMATATVDAQTELTSTALATPSSYPTGLESLSWVGGALTVGGTQVDIADLSVTGDNALKTDRRFIRQNVLKKEPLGDDYRAGGFKFTAEFDGLAQRNRVASATAAGAIAQIVGTFRGPTLAGVTTYPALVVTLNARLDSWASNVSGPAGLMQDVSGMYLDTNAISIAYTTTDVTP